MNHSLATEDEKVTSILKEVKMEPITLKSLGEYNREVSRSLPKETFKRNPLRLGYGVVFLGTSIAIVYSMLSFNIPFLAKIPLSLLFGVCLGGMAFVSHELLHGALVKSKRVQTVLGFIGFTPLMISPTYWRFWHNTLHHGNTQLLYKDPDAFPTKMIWKRSKFMQFVFPLSPGSGTIRSYFYFFYWFSFQAFLNQSYMRFGNKMWDKMNHTKVTYEFAIQLTLVLSYLYFIGPANWIWLFVIPFMIQNYTVMSYISTNHNISPYTKINDPLLNSLSVSNHPLLEKVHMNFGYHTEHHLFPSMPMSSAKVVHNKLKEMYPDRYQFMPKASALKILYSTSRIYKDRETLVHPISGEEYTTLGMNKILQ